MDVIDSQAEKASRLEDLAIFIDTKLTIGEIIEKADDFRREYEE